MPNALVIGASRGLGLGLARQLSERGWQVVGTERSRSEELHRLSQGDGIEVERVDVADPADAARFAERMDGRSFDLLYVNAGIMGASHQNPRETTREEAAQLFMTNSIGPVAVAQRLAPTVAKDGVIAFMTSQMGSIADNQSGGSYLYRASKAALNAAAKSFALSREAGGRTVLVLHPGWVQTDMGGPSARISVDESVAGLLKVIDQRRGTGEFAFLNYQGEELPW